MYVGKGLCTATIVDGDDLRMEDAFSNKLKFYLLFLYFLLTFATLRPSPRPAGIATAGVQIASLSMMDSTRVAYSMLTKPRGEVYV